MHFNIKGQANNESLHACILFQLQIDNTNSATGSLCDSLTIYPNQSCLHGVCTVPSFDPVPCSQTTNDGPGVIDVAISATNVLGSGPASIVHAGVCLF